MPRPTLPLCSPRLWLAGAQVVGEATAGWRMSFEPLQERRLLAIFAADVAGYSKLMRADEQGTLRALQSTREIIDNLISEHRGRIANTAGDSVLAEFPSVVDAIWCALA